MNIYRKNTYSPHEIGQSVGHVAPTVTVQEMQRWSSDAPWLMVMSTRWQPGADVALHLGCIRLLLRVNQVERALQLYGTLEDFAAVDDFFLDALTIYDLVGGDWNHGFFLTFHIYIYMCIYIHIGNVISPTDELIFFRGVGMPPTSDDLWRTWISCVFHARRMAAYKVGVRSMCYSRSIYSARKRVGCNLGYLSRLDVSVGAFLNTWGVEFCGWMALDSEDLISMIWPTGSELSFFQCLFPSSPCFFHTNYWRIYIYIILRIYV